MRLHIPISVALLFVSALFGQNRFGTPVLTGGFGNAVFPAGTPATNFRGLPASHLTPFFPPEAARAW